MRIAAELIRTGHGSAEASIAVAADGTVFFAPAFTADGVGVLRSRDDGRSWDVLIPGARGGRRHGRVQPFLYLDHHSGRLFFHTARLSTAPPSLHPGFDLSYSDDGGDNWDGDVAWPETRDWVKVYGAAGILYASGPAPISTRVRPIMFPRRQAVYRSHDGGGSWDEVGSFSLRPEDHGLPRSEWVICGAGVVASDGTVRIGLRRGPRLGIATSRDEGATWALADVPGSRLLGYRNLLQVGWINSNYVLPQPLAIDGGDNLYALWPDEHDLLRIATTRDGGATWTKPSLASAPDVRVARFAGISVRDPGTIALAYYGSPDGIAYHGYMARSANALDESPAFETEIANDPADPLYARGFDTGYLGMVTGGDLNEITGVAHTPTGDVVASFCKQLSGPPRVGWWGRVAPGRSRLEGALGRLRA